MDDDLRARFDAWIVTTFPEFTPKQKKDAWDGWLHAWRIAKAKHGDAQEREVALLDRVEAR